MICIPSRKGPLGILLTQFNKHHRSIFFCKILKSGLKYWVFLPRTGLIIKMFNLISHAHNVDPKIHVCCKFGKKRFSGSDASVFTDIINYVLTDIFWKPLLSSGSPQYGYFHRKFIMDFLYDHCYSRSIREKIILILGPNQKTWKLLVLLMLCACLKCKVKVEQINNPTNEPVAYIAPRRWLS